MVVPAAENLLDAVVPPPPLLEEEPEQAMSKCADIRIPINF